MLPLEKKQIITAIRKLRRKVTCADIAAQTGLPLHTSTLELNQIAAETNGHLDVAATGDITYSFHPGFQNTYLSTGIKRALALFGKKAFQAGFYLLRISFGIMLILSLLIIMVLAITVVMIWMHSGKEDKDSDLDIQFNFLSWRVLSDLFYWGAWSTYTPGYSTNTFDPKFSTSKPKKNFLFNCFSFLFGDGNPNFDLEKQRWQLVAQLIRKHNGVTTSAELAPYTGANPDNNDSVLPVLVRFNGCPEVTNRGNIIYIFPELQVIAAGESAKKLSDALKEKLWKFSNVSTDSLVPVFLLAAVNFLGSWWLLGNVYKITELHYLVPLVLLLVAYGTMFALVPLFRWLTILWLNHRIQSRNQLHQQYAELLLHPSPELSNKLQEAAQYRIKLDTLSTKNTVYTTREDLLEQEFK